MDIGSVSKRYAKALLAYAVELAQDAVVYDEMRQLAHSFQVEPKLQKILQNPIVNADQKRELILAASAISQASASSVLKRFAQFLIEQKRADIMLYVAHSYQGLYCKRNNIIKSYLTVPCPVSDATTKRMQSLLSNVKIDKVDLEVKIDPTMIGGFILQYGSYKLNASVDAQLAKVKTSLH